MFLVHLPHQTLRTILQQIHPWKLTCPLKRDWFNRKYIFQPSIFRGHSLVSGGGFFFNEKKSVEVLFFAKKLLGSQRHVHVVGVPSIVIENGGSTVDQPPTRSDPEIGTEVGSKTLGSPKDGSSLGPPTVLEKMKGSMPYLEVQDTGCNWLYLGL